jgi:hypothetical protein
MRLLQLVCAVSHALVGALACPLLSVAASFSADFEFPFPFPPGTGLWGNVDFVDGALQLTEAASYQFGAFVIPPLDAAPVTSFIATFQVHISDSTSIVPADGLSFNFSNAVPNPPTYGNPGEEGLPIGLSVNFDTFNNAFTDPNPEAPAIDVKMDGTIVGSVAFDPYTGPRFVDVSVKLDPDGTIDVSYDGMAIFNDLQTGHVSTQDGHFVFGARTGGANARHLIDNLSIITNPIPEPSCMALLLVGCVALAVCRG